MKTIISNLAIAFFFIASMSFSVSAQTTKEKPLDRYCPKKVCKLQSSYICVMNKKSTKNNEAYKRTKIGINF